MMACSVSPGVRELAKEDAKVVEVAVDDEALMINLNWFITIKLSMELCAFGFLPSLVQISLRCIISGPGRGISRAPYNSYFLHLTSLSPHQGANGNSQVQA